MKGIKRIKAKRGVGQALRNPCKSQFRVATPGTELPLANTREILEATTGNRHLGTNQQGLNPTLIDHSFLNWVQPPMNIDSHKQF